jgi:hypothetical protein
MNFFSYHASRGILQLMASPSGAPALHEELVRELASLPEAERRAVIAAAEQRAVRTERRPVSSFQSIRAAIGVMKGEPADAVDDTARMS